MTKAVPVRVFLSSEQAEALDALRGDESRSSWMRRMIQLAADQRAASSSKFHGETFEAGRLPAPSEPLKSERLTIRFNREEIDGVQWAAEQSGFAATAWVRQLVRRRLRVYRPYDHEIVEALWALRYQIRKIGVNLNQSVKAMRFAEKAENSADVRKEGRRVAELSEEVLELAEGVGKAVRGDASYWETP